MRDTQQMAAAATNQRPVGGNPAPRRCLAIFAIAIPLALSGCGSNTTTVETHTVTATAEPTTTTATTTPLRDAVSAWQRETLAPMQELGDAMDKISNASKVGDLTTMGITCQHAHDATEQLQQHMPSPDSDLTAALQKAISDYNSATQICTTAVENNNLTDFAQGSDILSEANNYMDAAVSILRRDLGLSSDSSGGAAKRSSTVPAQASPPSAQAQGPLPDADTHGFLNYGGAARCHGVDPAVLIVRTEHSAAVMCQSIPGEYYYRGLRLSDGGSIELAGATAAGTGFAVTNPADGTRYQLSRSGLEIQGPGQSVSESAIESAE
jgi:hypothetical protein